MNTERNQGNEVNLDDLYDSKRKRGIHKLGRDGVIITTGLVLGAGAATLVENRRSSETSGDTRDLTTRLDIGPVSTLTPDDAIGAMVARAESLTSTAFPVHTEQLAQLPTSTVEAENDPYAAIDEANWRLINTKINDLNNINPEKRAAARNEVRLTSPRFAYLIDLDIRPIAPDIHLAVGANSNGSNPIIYYNFNLERCLIPPLDNANVLGATVENQGPHRGTFLDPGIKSIDITPIDNSIRLDYADVQLFIPEYSVEINGQRTKVPVFVLKGYGFNGVDYDCPTIVESLRGRGGQLVDKVQNGLSNLELGQRLGDASEVMGKYLSEIGRGLSRGLMDR